MRQVHRAGEKAFVDYSGKKPHIVDRDTGELVAIDLFVMVLGASNYTYAEATRTQRLGDFVSSNIRAFEYFGCVPEIVVPDQLRSAVSGPHRYDPDINPTYLEMAQHYGVAIIPARPRKPKDKAKVEVGVQVAQRWILACLRNRTFFSLDELNAAIAELLERLNARPFQKLDGCRQSAFESIDRPAMKPLPQARYELAEWKDATVNIDYHVDCDGRLYSVPHALLGAQVEVRATTTTVEILHGGERVATHRRSYGPRGTPVTIEAHRPKSHRDYGAWPPSRVVSWAASIGPSVASVVERILADKPHPEQGYRSCMALIRTAKQYGHERTDAACRRALQIGAPTRKSVEAILKRGLDRAPVDDGDAAPRIVVHENVRGGEYFDKKEEGDDPGRDDQEVA
jgi:transposase